MERRIKWFAVIIIICFCLLEGVTLYWQVIRAPQLASDVRNPRLAQIRWERPRGGIYTRDGELLAGTRNEAGQEVRFYNLSPLLGPVIGYAHPLYGSAGVERQYEPVLTGYTGGWQKLRQWLQPPLEGWDLILTLDSRVQAALERAFAGRQGAAVALEPATGRILAVVSGPGFDPNQIAARFPHLRDDSASPLFNRAFSGLYPPGSVFKVLVLAAALEQGVTTPTETFVDKGCIVVDGFRLDNYNEQAFGRISPLQALSISSNAFFATLGLRLGARKLEQTMKAFQLHSPLLAGQAAACRWAEVVADGSTELASMSIGQGQLLVTPLHVANIAATIARGGQVIIPRLVAGTREPGGEIRWQEAKAEGQAVSPKVAGLVKKGMLKVVEEGTGRALQSVPVSVAAKTGTAETGKGKDHGWVMGFAPAASPQVAFAVVLENGGSGSGAARVAAKFLRSLVIP